MGYDNNLGETIGITLIPTGFQHKDPFVKGEIRKSKQKEEKIVMMLGQNEEGNKKEDIKTPVEEKKVIADLLKPSLVEDFPAMEAPMPSVDDMIELEIEEEKNPAIHWELKQEE